MGSFWSSLLDLRFYNSEIKNYFFLIHYSILFLERTLNIKPANKPKKQKTQISLTE